MKKRIPTFEEFNINEGQQEDQVLDTLEKIKSWLDLMNIQNYTINDDLTVDVKGHVKLKKQKFKKFPIKFGKIYGDFDCSGCTSLTSLEGAPQEVGGDFNCDGCTSLTSLEGAPQKVGGDFNCNGCTSLTSLEGAPQKVGGDFNCKDWLNESRLRPNEELGCDWFKAEVVSVTNKILVLRCEGDVDRSERYTNKKGWKWFTESQNDPLIDEIAAEIPELESWLYDGEFDFADVSIDDYTANFTLTITL